MMYGLDYLGGAKYKDVILRYHPKGMAAGFFLKVDGFGDATPVIDALAKSGKTPLIRVHCMWKDKHDFTTEDFNRIAERAKIVENLARKYPSVDFRVSGACEHRLSLTAAKRLASLVKAAAPNCQFINTPDKTGAIIVEEINEFHHDEEPRKARRMQFSFDGKSAVDSNVERYKESYKAAGVFFFWIPQFNGRMTLRDETPRPKRISYPTPELLRSVSALASDRGPINFADIYKSHAEQTEENTEADKRGNRPVIIVDENVEKLELFSGSKLIATARNGGSFSGGGYRYYVGEYGYKLAAKAVKLNNSPQVTIKAKRRILGIINPIFRQGSFR